MEGHFFKFITQEQKKEQTSFRKVLVHIEIHRIILRELGRKVLSSENNSKSKFQKESGP